MLTKAPAFGTLEVVLGLRRGTAPRTVTITIEGRGEKADAAAASRVFDAFANFVDACRFLPGRVQIVSAATDSSRSAGIVESWTVAFPKMHPDAFAVLARMTERSVPGARRLVIREQAPDFTLLVRELETDAEATIADVPWEIAFTAARTPCVRLTLATPATPEISGTIARGVHAWAEVLGLGGFPGAEGARCSKGRVDGVETGSEWELVARLSDLACGYDAWEALFQVLSVAADRCGATVLHVEIQGGFEGIRGEQSPR